MSWIALLFAVSDVVGATPPSSPSNTAAGGDGTVSTASTAPAPPAAHWSPWLPPQPQSSPEPPPAGPTARDEFAAHPVTIESRLGKALPTGEFGGALSYSPIPAIGFDCGAGTNGKGLQLACGLRARLVLDTRWRSSLGASTHALTLTSGFSTGAYVDDHALEKLTWVDGPGPASRSYQRAYWWNTDVGLEERYETVVLRAFAGAARLLNPDAGMDLVTETGQQIETPTTSLVYVGIGVGVLP